MLQYTVSQRNNIAVVSLVGDMTLASLETIDELRIKIESLPVHHLILNFTEVIKITEEALRPITLIQAGVRRENLNLRVCGLNQELTRFLLSHGAVRKGELFVTLLDGIKSLDLKAAA